MKTTTEKKASITKTSVKKVSSQNVKAVPKKSAKPVASGNRAKKAPAPSAEKAKQAVKGVASKVPKTSTTKVVKQSISAQSKQKSNVTVKKSAPKKTEAPATKNVASTKKRAASDDQNKEAKALKLEKTSLDDDTVIQTNDLPGEVTVARVPRVKVFQLSGGKWDEIGPGSVKVSINEELVDTKGKKKQKKSKSSCNGRFIFHDAMNRNIRLNLALGSTLSIATSSDPKIVMFTAVYKKESSGEDDTAVVQETYLIKEVSSNPRDLPMAKFKEHLLEWNSKL